MLKITHIYKKYYLFVFMTDLIIKHKCMTYITSTFTSSGHKNYLNLKYHKEHNKNIIYFSALCANKNHIF